MSDSIWHVVQGFFLGWFTYTAISSFINVKIAKTELKKSKMELAMHARQFQEVIKDIEESNKKTFDEAVE